MPVKRLSVVVFILCIALPPASVAQEKEVWLAAGWPERLIPVVDTTQQWPNQYDPWQCYMLEDIERELDGRNEDDPVQIRLEDASVISGRKIRTAPDRLLRALRRFANTCPFLFGYDSVEDAETLARARKLQRDRHEPPISPSKFSQLLDEAERKLDERRKNKKKMTTQVKIKMLEAESRQEWLKAVKTEDVLVDVLERLDMLWYAHALDSQIANEQSRRLTDWMRTEIESVQKQSAAWKDLSSKLEQQVAAMDKYIALLETRDSQLSRSAASTSGADWATILGNMSASFAEIQKLRQLQEIEQQQRWQNYHLWVIGDELLKLNRLPF